MNKYELYNKVLASVNEDEGTFNAAARNWIEGTENASFNNEEADELYNKAKVCCGLWRKGAINGRISKRRMIDCVRKIAEMKLPNPYDPNEPDPDAVVETAEEVIEEVKQPIHVLGVIPEDKEPVGDVHLGFEKFDAVEQKEEQKEEIAEEPKEESKHLFGKRKKK